MIEKVNPAHPDKVADRIAGAIVDLAYRKDPNPKIAVEVLIGHGECHIIAESSVQVTAAEATAIVDRIAGAGMTTELKCIRQDGILAANQSESARCGDNGIFRGVPLTGEEITLSDVARRIYSRFPTDGKYILDGKRLIVCQSNAENKELARMVEGFDATINPLGEWTGGTDVDTGATNRKLGSDMAQSVTGGGLHGKDLSKADVTLNILAFRQAQQTGKPVEICCAIGDDTIMGRPYPELVQEAKEFITSLGGFEKFAEWGLY